jgi:HEAT repeat protein
LLRVYTWWAFRDDRLAVLGQPYYGKTLEQWVNDLDDADVSVRGEAAGILARLVHEKSAFLRHQAAKWLMLKAEDLGSSEARAATPELILALQEGDVGRRYDAARVLGRFGEKAQEAIPYLIQALEEGRGDDDTPQIVIALGRMAALANAATPALMRELDKKPGPRVDRSLVVWALGRIKGEEALPRLLELAVADKEEYHLATEIMHPVRRAACEALAEFPNHSKVIVPVLEAALQDEAPSVRQAALRSLARFYSNARTAAPR